LFIYTSLQNVDDISEDLQGLIRIKSIITLLSLLLGNGIFTFITLKIKAASENIIQLQLNENHKYKYMFNVLRDPILLVKGEEVLF